MMVVFLFVSILFFFFFKAGHDGIPCNPSIPVLWRQVDPWSSLDSQLRLCGDTQANSRSFLNK